MKNSIRITLFISCPSDIKDEMDSIELIVKEINKTSGKHDGYHLSTIHWKTDVYTQVAEDAQEVVNQQFDNQYDILIGILWQRIGSPTKRDKSGTIEEINRAINNKEKELLVFFRTSAPENLNDINLSELAKVQEFKKELGEKGVHYKEHDSTANFETLFRLNLSNLIKDKILSKAIDNNSIVEVEKINEDLSLLPKRYSEISSFIKVVENQDPNIINIDVFELFEEASNELDILTNSLSRMTEYLNELGEDMESKTEKINTISNIKDERLKKNKGTKVINELAQVLEIFNNKIQEELPVFSSSFNNVGNSYSKVILAANSYSKEEVGDLIESANEFRLTSENSMKSCMTLIQEFMQWPPLNFKFNAKKRDTELVLNDLLKSMLNGQMLLDEALGLDLEN